MHRCIRAVRSYKHINPNARCFSSAQKVIVKHDSDTGIATVYMNNPPVNGLDGEMLKACTDAAKTLDKDSNVRGIVVTSNFDGKVFCAGLNILDLYQKSAEHVAEFWTNVQDWYLAWYGCRKPTVAAINGHAPAAGCAFAMMCDYRVMQSGGDDVKKIGLNETQFGLFVPFFVAEMMTSTIGIRKAEEAILKGKMFTADQALNMGMIDKVAPLDSVIPTATAELKKFLTVPLPAFASTKLSLRQDVINRLLKVKQEDAEHIAAFITDPKVQSNLGKYLDRLKAKKK